MELEEFDKLLEKREILPFSDLKVYIGTFTGKIVKKEEKIEYGCFNKFKKGDRVIVFNYNDYFKWRKGMDILINDLREMRKKNNKS